MPAPIATPEQTRAIHHAISRRLDEIDQNTVGEGGRTIPAFAADVDTVHRFITLREGMAKRRLAHLAEHAACGLLHVASL